MSDQLKDLYAWLGKWETKVPEQARHELRKILSDEEEARKEVMRSWPKAGTICKRGQLTVNPKTGQPFEHEIDKGLGYCLWCGAGAPPPKEDPNANLLAKGGRDKAWCDEHGVFHEFDVSPEGKILNPPECEMFKKPVVGTEEEADRA